jgi:hypothetical protein
MHARPHACPTPLLHLHAQTVRLYDAAAFTARGTIQLAAPVLDVCVQDDSTAYAGSLDGQVSRCVRVLCVCVCVCPAPQTA